MPKLEALNQLITLAEAWNYFDEFEPDWENRYQNKYYPVFGLRGGEIVLLESYGIACILDFHVLNFSFKTPERAEQLGRQFIELFRIVLTN